MRADYLFAHGNLRDVLEAHRQKMVAAIDAADASQVANGQSIEDIANSFGEHRQTTNHGARP
jgi:hypothetical protein